MSTTSEIIEANEAADTKIITPKRRGRKRKSELAMEKNSEIAISPPPESISKRGRRRRKVNYYELINPDNFEEIPTEVQSQTNYISLENKERKVIIEQSVVAVTNVALGADKEEEDIIVKKQPYDQCEEKTDEKCEEKTDDEKCDENNLNKGNNVNSNVSNQTEQADNNIEGDGLVQDGSQIILEQTELQATTSTPKTKDKRYNYTGETVKMMNTLFNLFANNVDEKTANNTRSNSNVANGTSNNISSGSEQNTTNNNKRVYRKNKGKIKDKEIDDGGGNVTCAVCNTALDKTVWNHHKQRYHNNLAWRVGDPPLDLSDQSFVMHTLNLLYKRKKPLYCDKCGEVKKSVVGFLSHQSTCRKSEEQLESVKIACQICGRKMLPVSLSTHMKFSHPNPAERDESTEKINNENKPLPTKRSAARKAMKIIDNVTRNNFSEEKYFTSNLDFGLEDFAVTLMQKELEDNQVIECKFKCDFCSNNLDEALKHLHQCPLKPLEGFVCKQCLLVSIKLEDIIFHIEFAHEISIEVDDESTLAEKSAVKIPLFLSSTRKKTERVLFPKAFEWTYTFHQENFSNLLFENLSFNDSNWPLLPSGMAAKYLPNMNESCDTARIYVTSFTNPLHQEYKFRKYKLFESELHEDNKITLFCGGPISTLSWLPTPYAKENENQILAVSVLNSPDDKYFISENYQVSSAIQFWNFGRLQNKQSSMAEPKLIFNVAHDHGPVWHMEWCPSGCHNFDEEKISRMGLLAVTGSDSFVYIYSIPFFNEEDTGLFYKPKPRMKLMLQQPESSLLGGLKYYPSKISWTKATGHNYIAVGYTNGLVALFSLKTHSPLLKYKDSDAVTCILPYKCFQAHSHSISALALYHLNEGCRWLMTGSLDRGVSLWDLNDCSYAICSTKKNIITDGFWFTNWLCHQTASDEGSTSIYVTTMLKQARDFLYESNITMTCSPSTISSTTGSDWLNGVLHGNTVGEIVALFPHQILQIPEHHKVFKRKRMLFGYTCLIEKEKTPEERVDDEKIRKKTLQHLLSKKQSIGVKFSKIRSDFDNSSLFCNEPVVYEQAQQKYGLLFCDNKMESYDDFPQSTASQLLAFSKACGIIRPNQYPMTAINKIVFNPNRQASLYYATGYQTGFVRISWMKFLRGDEQIK